MEDFQYSTQEQQDVLHQLIWESRPQPGQPRDSKAEAALREWAEELGVLAAQAPQPEINRAHDTSIISSVVETTGGGR